MWSIFTKLETRSQKKKYENKLHIYCVDYEIQRKRKDYIVSSRYYYSYFALFRSCFNKCVWVIIVLNFTCKAAIWKSSEFGKNQKKVPKTEQYSTFRNFSYFSEDLVTLLVSVWLSFMKEFICMIRISKMNGIR
jgi:hypothetical protein